ncbi:transcriptional regulator [Psychromonas sp. CNPT3]|uniref:LysR family transcriptional regulator n=1 Tax=Psychromonas sp. CNPT3 TaxID=314282 RepID=UPI00006E3C17|nr:LysR family transcriptional regulator [Psychromonas sp. CNPT3]AGH81050.1 transcriptional regulator [Psychromonas sp. CNPT3]
MQNIKDFDLHLLDLFVTIVELGGFSAAQSKLNMHQSTISTKMTTLEVRLGMTLCHRGRRGFYLTNDGENVYKLCLKIFNEIASFEEALNNIRNISNGHIILTLTDNIATNPNCKIKDAIKSFSNLYPKITMKTDVFDSFQIEMMLLDERIELGVTSSEIRKKGLTYLSLFDETQSLYCAAMHPVLDVKGKLSAKKMAAFNLIDRGVSHKITPLTNLNKGENVATSVNMEATVHLILSGNFIGYLPDHFADIWVSKGEMIKINAPDLDYTAAFHLTLLTSKELSLAARKLKDLIIKAHTI